MLSLAMTGCAQSPANANADPAAVAPAPSSSSPSQAANPMNATLGGYHWRLQDATGPRGQRLTALLARPELPLQFDFVDGRLRVVNACNSIGGEASIDGDIVRIGALRATKMACMDAAVMALDDEIGRRLQGNARIRLLESDPPQLVWTAANGDVLRFVGAPTPETRYGSPGTTVFMEVAARTKPCKHPMMPNPQTCLEVREVQFAEGLRVGEPGAWQLFHDTIDGYTHEDGIRTVLRVKRFDIADPPMDAPSVGYVLDTIIESEMTGP
jgi:heat shock protein HslJ